MDSVDTRLATLAAGQHGLVTLQQARLWGLSEAQVRARLRAGRWDRVGRGVYRIAGTPASWRQRALAACLAGPDGAAVSHLTASAVHLDGVAPPRPHLLVGRGRSVRVAGAIVHRARLTPTDITIVDGIPVTTIGRTLIDCASLLGPARLERLANDALHRKLIAPGQVPAYWDKARLRPGRAGEVRLREVLEPWSGGIRPGSPAELRLRRQVVEWGYPTPELQVIVRTEDGTVLGRIDAGWSGPRIGIEYDSEEFHGPTRWTADEARHCAITELGWTLIHADKLDLRSGQSSLRSALARAWRANRMAV